VNIIIFLKDKKKTRKKKGIKEEAKASIIFNKKMNDTLFIEKKYRKSSNHYVTI
jgi:hypothetical protein